MKSLQESILNSTKSGKSQIFKENPEEFFKFKFGDDVRVNCQNGRYFISGEFKNGIIEIDDEWPDIKISYFGGWYSGHRFIFKIDGNDAYNKFLSSFSMHEDKLGYYSDKYPTQSTTFIFEKCKVNMYDLPKLSGRLKFKNCDVDWSKGSKYPYGIEGEVYFLKCKVSMPYEYEKIKLLKIT